MCGVGEALSCSKKKGLVETKLATETKEAYILLSASSNSPSILNSHAIVSFLCYQLCTPFGKLDLDNSSSGMQGQNFVP